MVLILLVTVPFLLIAPLSYLVIVFLIESRDKFELADPTPSSPTPSSTSSTSSHDTREYFDYHK
jgi:hypothetical protein